MTDYNGGKRQTKMTSEASSQSSRSSPANHGLPQTMPTARTMEPSDEYDISLTSEDTIDDISRSLRSSARISSIHPSLPTTIAPNSTEALEPTSASGSWFGQLTFEKLETYMNETRADQIVPPLQEMIHGYKEGFARLAQSTHDKLQSTQNQLQFPYNHTPKGKFLEPIALRRNIQSTPLLRHTPVSALSAINDEGDCNLDGDEDYPPPAGLEILDSIRSRSTPLTTSENSAFGTILRTNSHSIYSSLTTSQTAEGNIGSAFSLPPYVMTKANSRSNERAPRPVIFNPIVHEDEILKTVDGNDAEGEMTSIEVTDVPMLTDEKESQSQRPGKKKSAASIAVQLLTNVRNLTKIPGNKRVNSGGSSNRFRPRDGRENPARPASISSDEQPRSSTVGSVYATTANNNNIADPATSTRSRIEEGSPLLNASDNTGVDNSSNNDRVRIEVNDNSGNSIDIVTRQQYCVSSPEPSDILGPMEHSLAARIQDSPDSTRYPTSISNSSGRTSQGTSTSNSSNGRSHHSQLSAISETDREVANVNLPQHDRRLQKVGEEIELSLSSDRSIRSGDLNASISIASPDSGIRRDGASVRADRFFNYRKDSSRLRNLPPSARRGGTAQSPTPGSSAASMNTSISTASDEPPQIVTYMDRKQVSDLSSLHHRQYSLETSSPRATHDLEVRDSSPSEQMHEEHSEVMFEGANGAQIDFSTKPRSLLPGNGIPSHSVRKNRSLPPRSPLNSGFSSASPPPRGGSPGFNAISPPRQIVGHRVELVLTHNSKSGVLAPISFRSNPKTLASKIPLTPVTDTKGAFLQEVDLGIHEIGRLSPNCDYYNLKPAARGLSPVYGQQNARTYEESCIEILKTDSKDDNSIPLVTPDKGNATA